MKQLLIPIFSLFVFLASCSNGNLREHIANNGIVCNMEYAENLTLIKYDHYTKAVLRNPWDTTSILQTYILVSEDINPDSLPEGVIIKTPIKNALVYSSVHCTLICELGGEKQIGGVCDSEYIYAEELKNRLANGTLADCGNSMSPNFEKIIKLHPQAIFLSPYENNNGYGKLDKLNIPIILCADYMETSALGRAEWVKFYGLLFGQEKKANELFSQVSSNFINLKEKAKNSLNRPKVLSDTRYGQIWYMPGGHSTMGQLYEDAGALNPFGYLEQSGSAPLSAEQVFDKAHDADVWIIKYNQPTDKTLKELSKEDAIYKQFKPFKEGNVYGSNTSTSRFYEETPYHPDRLLADFIQIFHPELGLEHKLKYFKKLEKE